MARGKDTSRSLRQQDSNVNSSPRSSQMGSQKRKANVVDLTSDTEEPPARRVQRSSNASHRVQDQPINVNSDDDDEDDGWDDLIASTQEIGISQYDDYTQFGVIDTKIVGIRYYNGQVTVGERILIQREPSNQYDSNAIRVDNVRSEQIGHIPRQMAAKLAKYIDNRWLSLDGILIGEKGAFDCPIRIVTYGPVEPRDQEAEKREDRNGGQKAQEAYRHLLEVLLRMRQVCNHWQMCKERVQSLLTALKSRRLWI